MKEKKYSGYGYHGGGRPKKDESEKVQYKKFSVCLKLEEVEQIRKLASDSGLTVSRFIAEKCLK